MKRRTFLTLLGVAQWAVIGAAASPLGVELSPRCNRARRLLRRTSPELAHRAGFHFDG